MSNNRFIFLLKEYEIEEEMVIFKLNLTSLIECLNIFGGGTAGAATPSLKMVYRGHGYPLVLECVFLSFCCFNLIMIFLSAFVGNTSNCMWYLSSFIIWLKNMTAGSVMQTVSVTKLPADTS